MLEDGGVGVINMHTLVNRHAHYIVWGWNDAFKADVSHFVTTQYKPLKVIFSWVVDILLQMQRFISWIFFHWISLSAHMGSFVLQFAAKLLIETMWASCAMGWHFNRKMIKKIFFHTSQNNLYFVSSYICYPASYEDFPTLHLHPLVGRESIAGCRQKVWYPLSHMSHTSILVSSPGFLQREREKV